MINGDNLKGLNLDDEWVQRDLQLSQDLAEGYNILAHRSEGSKADDAFLVSASYYRRAAAHALLLGRYGYRHQYSPASLREADAYHLFAEATNAYENAGTPYSLFLRIFSPRVYGDENLIDRWVEHLAPSEEWHPQLVYLLLYAAVLLPNWRPDNDVLYSIRQGMELYRLEPIGVLGTPIGNYLDLIDAITARSNVDAIEQAIYPFLAQYDFSVRQALKNEYHWQRLAMPFHPAEPDTVGVMRYADRALSFIHTNRSLLQTIRESRLEHHSMSLLYGILSDYGKDGGDDAGSLHQVFDPKKY